MQTQAPELPPPVDVVRTGADAWDFVTKTGRSYVTVRDGDSLPGPWYACMQVRGGWIWSHPARAALHTAYVDSLPPYDDDDLLFS